MKRERDVPEKKKKAATTKRQRLTTPPKDEKACSPFWTPSRQEASRKLWSPTQIGLPEPTALNVLPENSTRHATWFRSLKIQESTPPTTPSISSRFVTSSWPATTAGEPLPCVEVDSQGSLKIPKIPKSLPAPVKAMKIRLHARNDKDRETLRKVFGCVRWTYNKCVHLLRETKKTTPLKELRALFVKNDSEAVINNPWLKEVGFDIRCAALDEFQTALKGNFTKMKNGDLTSFDIHYRSKKKQTSETFYLRKKWIHQTKNTIVLKLPKTPKIVLWSGRTKWRTPILMDCKFQRTWTGEYYLCIPYAYGVDNQDSVKKETLRVCSLDPGVRTFQTIFDATNGHALQVAPSDMGRIMRLCYYLDQLISKQSQAKRSKQRYSLRRAARRARTRIQDLVNEVHKQLAKHLATNYDLILLPKFETSQMVKRKDRVIGSQTARQMVTWAHYRFQQRLLFKCRQYNCRVAIVDESYTSKTCSSCGALDYKLGGKKVYRCASCKMVMDRDINGAKNIFLKNFEALTLVLALGPTPCSPETDCCTETLWSLLDLFDLEALESFEALEV
ncbi:MAG: transposase [archaeon]|nr:transposase [archaeon]